MMVFSFLYDVFGIFVEAKDIVKCVVVFTGCCLGRASQLYTSSFITDEINL